ncbi:hypothetical protein NST36_19190 [Bacillus sp. FSL R5-0293]|uniref:hypothetical protein n=1 Tax=Bacillus sp. FSL R5-0293 TaxID=2954584 RepID=UPI0030FBCED7
MWDQSSLKKAVEEIIFQMINPNKQKGREWYFPENIDNQYKVFANATVKDLFLVIVPFFSAAIGIASIPPYDSVLFWIIKSIFMIPLLIVPLIWVNYRPVSSRKNIRMKDYLKEVLEYRKKQKIYFRKQKSKELNEI